MKPSPRLHRLDPPGRLWLLAALVGLLAVGGVAVASSGGRTAKVAASPASATASPASATASPASSTASTSSPARPVAAAAAPSAPSSAAPPAVAPPVAGAAASSAAPRTVDLSGTIEPVQQWALDFGTSGLVADVYVRPGQSVRAGAVLARLDAAGLTSAESQVRVQRASLAQAQANLEARVGMDQQALAAARQALTAEQGVYDAAQRAYRLESPVDSMLTLAQDQQALAQQKAQLQADRQAVPQAEAQLAADRRTGQQAVQVARMQLQADEASAAATRREAIIRAPTTGTVGQVNLTAGQWISPGSSPAGASGGAGAGGGGSGSGAAGADITLIGRGGFEVLAAVPDAQISEVHVGQRAVVTPAGALQPVPAVVSQITPQATAGSGEAAYPVTLTVAADVPGLLSGAGAEVAIQVGGAPRPGGAG